MEDAIVKTMLLHTCVRAFISKSEGDLKRIFVV